MLDVKLRTHLYAKKREHTRVTYIQLISNQYGTSQILIDVLPNLENRSPEISKN